MVHFGMSFVKDVARKKVQGITDTCTRIKRRDMHREHAGQEQLLIYPFRLLLLTVLLAILVQEPIIVRAQGGGTNGTPTTVADPQDEISAPEQVDVQPVARYEEIAQRLLTILQLTE